MRPILIVDDHPDPCIPLLRLFRFAGIDVRLVPGGREALAAVIERRPDVILLDVMMPDMDGYQVLRALRADARHDGIAVLMYTAGDDAAGAARAAGLGAQGYLAKGIPFAELQGHVRRHLAGPPAA